MAAEFSSVFAKMFLSPENRPWDLVRGFLSSLIIELGLSETCNNQDWNEGLLERSFPWR